MHIVIITSSAKALFNLRKELIESWISGGHKVTAIGDLPEKEFSSICNKNGFEYRGVTLQRNGLNPVKDYRTIEELTILLKQLNPDRVFCTFAKAIAYGAWAARRVGLDNTYSLISGLGSPFRGKSLKEKLIKIILSQLYKNAFKGCKKIIFQNNDDLSELVNLKLLDKSKAVIVNGSGVDLIRFNRCPLPNNSTFLFIGRLLKEKGICEYIKAAEIVRETCPNSRFMVVGDIDTNPSSLSKTEVEYYQRLGLIEFYGFQTDVRPFIEKSDVFVLPSYHEGTPRCVLEAMSMGRPIITTDAPGCKETVTDGVNGFLVPVGNVNVLVEKMKFLLENESKAIEMGQQSRKIAENKYDVNKVNRDYFKIMNL